MSRDDIAVALEDLAAAIRGLEGTIADTAGDEPPARSRELPTLDDVLKVTDERAIPALIGLLEAQIRALTLLQRGSRAVRRGRDVNTRLREATGDGSSIDRTAAPIVDRMGETIDEIQNRLGDSSDAETRALLERTRSLYEEIDRRLSDHSPENRSDGYRIEIDDGSPDTDPDEAADRGKHDGERSDGRQPTSAGDHVDVDAELQTLRDRYGADDGRNGSTEHDTVESADAGADRPKTDGTDRSEDTRADESESPDVSDSTPSESDEADVEEPNGTDAPDSSQTDTGPTESVDGDDPGDEANEED
ncbi:MSCRAMM family adhesin SdrC [Halovivax cerinus]|uniref:MSCRAMM family adhesin SdrC n=1 Tax=Halovivax cerinus TaxID=1487865 RepID=A0ABD5NN59_9EURY|nr:MSCRAMM family adhesin SdrC [Halovivax cerinus]